MGMTQRTLLLDANNLLMRSIKAAEGRLHLSVEIDGREVNTGPLLLFVNLVAKYIRQEQPYRVVACWDGGRSAHRISIFEHYKAARNEASAEAPKDMTPFGLAKEFLTLAGIHHIEMTSVEADDLVAAYWHRKGNDDRLTIVSGDKDFLQLLDGWTEQIRPGGPTPEAERWTCNRVRTEMGCKPEHIPYVMALTGDSGDGVPGIPGFGTKTAVKFLTKHNWSLDALLAANEPKLAFQADAVRRNLALVDLRTPIPGISVPEPPRFEPTEPSSLLYETLLEWLGQFRMESVQNRLSSHTLWR
jgi:5'-3' exonuclease